jgi:uncharacterized membrane protein HdeD (DUF308 family)
MERLGSIQKVNRRKYTDMSMLKSPGWLRAIQIGFGIIIVILSIIVILNPIVGFLSIIWLLGILLFIIGIEMIISHGFTPHRSRFAGIGLGIAVIVLAIISISFPLIASVIVISLLGIALLLSGISKIIHGINDKHNKNWKRGLSIAAGSFSIILAIMIFIFPVLGIAFAGLLIGIALLVTGLQMITNGVASRSEMRDTKDLV